MKLIHINNKTDNEHYRINKTNVEFISIKERYIIYWMKPHNIQNTFHYNTECETIMMGDNPDFYEPYKTKVNIDTDLFDINNHSTDYNCFYNMEAGIFLLDVIHDKILEMMDISIDYDYVDFMDKMNNHKIYILTAGGHRIKIERLNATRTKKVYISDLPFAREIGMGAKINYDLELVQEVPKLTVGVLKKLRRQNPYGDVKPCDIQELYNNPDTIGKIIFG